MRRRNAQVAIVAVVLSVITGCSAHSSAGSATGGGHRVLRVGSYQGSRGNYRSIQAAVDAARPGDWILVGPGDYKASSSRKPRGRTDVPAAVLITTPELHIRGMNRNTVVVDATKPGSPECSHKAADQNLGPAGGGGNLGLNGIMVWKAANVGIQNLTVCNFLDGNGDTGNAIWWNGGDDEDWNGGPDPNDKIGGHGYYGSYLTATSSFYNGEDTAASYGIFSSDWSGGEWDNTYASNFITSGYYIGACQQVCDQTINHAWAEYNALGYEGSNSGGRLVIENSQMDNNLDGINANSANGDNPPPQNGACPKGGVSPITDTHSCTVFIHNYVHNNNNVNVPVVSEPPPGSVPTNSLPYTAAGIGIVIDGGRNDTIIDNQIVGNDAWGVTLNPLVDHGPPCTGGTLNFKRAGSCVFDAWGNAIIDNQFGQNGRFGHPTNGDFGYVTFEDGHPTNCFRGNTAAGGGSVKPASAAALQVKSPSCTGELVPAGASDARLLGEAVCDSLLEPIPGQPRTCPTGHYPQGTHVVMHPLPKDLPTMPDPCAGVPANPWCPASKATSGG
jgi:hypothetical protein